MTHSIDHFRRAAKQLRKAVKGTDATAQARVQAIISDKSTSDLKHADFLHVIAREQGHRSWPDLKLAIETEHMDRQHLQRRMAHALFNGQPWLIERLFDMAPDVAEGSFVLNCATFNLASVSAMLAGDPSLATTEVDRRRPILHLAFSQYLKVAPHLEDDMLQIANLLLQNGADVNDSFPYEPGGTDMLSVLYGAIGHSNNMALGQLLLDRGANPNDGESLYHSTELGHHDGLKMLLAAGANPIGTNALLRAIDFDDAKAVGLLLDAGADPNEGLQQDGTVTTIPAMNHAARRRAGPAVIRSLSEHGARADLLFKGHSAYAMAAMMGNDVMVQHLQKKGEGPTLDHNENVIAEAVKGNRVGRLENPISEEIKRCLERLLRTDISAERIKTLIDVGVNPDWTDEMGLPAIQVAGWEGRADVVTLMLGPDTDLDQKNGFGGDLLGTILHGAEHCPDRAKRDHVGCLSLVLEAGAIVRQAEIDGTGRADISEILLDWTERHPEKLVQ